MLWLCYSSLVNCEYATFKKHFIICAYSIHCDNQNGYEQMSSWHCRQSACITIYLHIAKHISVPSAKLDISPVNLINFLKNLRARTHTHKHMQTETKKKTRFGKISITKLKEIEWELFGFEIVRFARRI